MYSIFNRKSKVLRDDNKGVTDDDKAGWETRRKYFFLNNRLEAGDPENGRFRFSVRLEDIFVLLKITIV